MLKPRYGYYFVDISLRGFSLLSTPRCKNLSAKVSHRVDTDDIGSGKSKLEIFPTKLSDTVPISTCKKLHGLCNGLSTFYDYIGQLAPAFEITPFIRGASGSWFLRKKNAQDEWVLLHLRAVSEQNGATAFTGIGRKHMANSVIGFEVTEQVFYWFPIDGKQKIPDTIRVSLATNNKYRKFHVADEKIQDLLENVWKTHEKRSLKGWCSADLFPKPQDQIWMASLLFLWTKIFDPLQFGIRFPILSADTVSNILVDGIPTILRHIVVRDYRDGRAMQYYLLLEKSVNASKTEFYAKDKVRFLICVLRGEGDIRGIYVFPKGVLASRGYLRNPEEQVAGKRYLGIFPPWVTVRYKPVREQQQWQNEYYLDLSNETCTEQSRLKFLKIFNDNK